MPGLLILLQFVASLLMEDMRESLFLCGELLSEKVSKLPGLSFGELTDLTLALADSVAAM